MIDPTNEQVFTLAEATRLKWLPSRRAGKQPHVSTFIRWAKTGCRGVRLETVRVGGTLCTSEEALVRFFRALSEPSGKAVAPTQHDEAQADAILDAAGV